eukprot:TRINITY_DN69_c0_g1_i1.p1 TRINITY_DN69_c0_g1~~TRINITY_DN69_c0_g1_i1.p1  ORF type:complete len:147 (-),score=29.53 TRINITY_DN69_c0_g1_i1:29-469(-)
MMYTPHQVRAAMFLRPKQEFLTQRQRVLRQYKAVLVTLRDHAGFYRDFYFNDVGEARAIFESSRGVTDETEIERLIEKGNKWLEQHKHWAPYTIPYLPGGSKYQRNEAVPHELLEQDRLVDFEAEIMSEFDTLGSDPLRKGWRVDN